VNPPPAAALMGRALFRDDFVCLVCAASPLRHGLDLDAYCRSPHALVSLSGTGLGVVDVALEALGRSRRVAARIRYFLAAPSLVQGTDLVLTLPRRVAEALDLQGRVAVVEPPLDLPTFTVHMVWHRRLDADPAHRWLRERTVALHE
jgi:DNA-binding transcriptional LysR family regulator